MFSKKSKDMFDYKISIIGSGNVAYQLSKVFSENNLPIVEVISRNRVEGKKLSKLFNLHFQSQILSYKPLGDIVILAVADDAIAPIVQQIDVNGKIVAHTSGMASMHLLKDASNKYGSFYPLQTFTKKRVVDFQTIPILIDGNHEEVIELLSNLAKLISKKVSFIKDDKRSQLHLAAVLVNNFSNHLFTLAENYCKLNDLDFSILHPLILETAHKTTLDSPRLIQTGPALRKDQKTIEKHLSHISDETLKKIYLHFTKSIQKMY